MDYFVVCLFLARKKYNTSFWESPVSGSVVPALREDVEHADIAAAEYLVHACLARSTCVRSLARAPGVLQSCALRAFRMLASLEVCCLGKNMCFFCYIK